ncbi:MAG: helix-turn-helix domain-containing protein [Lachnospiraceae bacterium]
MKPRTKPLGDRNMIGANVTKIRKLNKMSQNELATNMQLLGIDINLTSLSKLEGQTRIATDREIFAIAQIFKIKMEDLFKDL